MREIYAEKCGRRGRLKDLLAALTDKKRIGTLRLAVYDIAELDGKPLRGRFDRTWEKLHEVFGRGELIREVDMEVAKNPQQVSRIYEKWVVGEKSEGAGATCRSSTRSSRATRSTPWWSDSLREPAPSGGRCARCCWP